MSQVVQSEAHQQLMYADNVRTVHQQRLNRIRPAVTIVPASGEAQSASDLVGKVDAVRHTSINRRNTENPPKLDRRWLIMPDMIDSGQIIDTEEKLQKTQDPTSQYVTTHTLAVEREVGDVMLGVIKGPNGVFEVHEGGVLGGASSGKRPGGPLVDLPTRCFSPDGGVGLNLDKLKFARQRLKEDDFGLEDDDQLYCAISPHQENELLSLAEGNGEGLNAFMQSQLSSGKPTPLMGLMWIVTNRLPRDANGHRMVTIWSKNNIVCGMWQDVQGRMWNDTHQKNRPVVQVEAYVDCVRVEDLGVHVLPCVEA